LPLLKYPKDFGQFVDSISKKKGKKQFQLMVLLVHGCMLQKQKFYSSSSHFHGLTDGLLITTIKKNHCGIGKVSDSGDFYFIYFTFIIVTLSERRVYFYCIASLELAAIQCIYYPTYVKERVSWVVKTWGAEASRTKVLGLG